jgi:hypothetical protein
MAEVTVKFKVEENHLIIAVALLLKEVFPDGMEGENIEVALADISEEEVLKKLKILYQRSGSEFIRFMTYEKHSLEAEGFVEYGTRWNDNYKSEE